MTCHNCGAGARGNFCEYCGTKLNNNQNTGCRPQPPAAPQPKYSYHYHYTNDRQQPFAANPGSYGSRPQPPPPCAKCDGKSPKSLPACFIVCLLFGVLGIHRFYAGKIATGLLYFFTGGLFAFGYLTDLAVILAGGFKDGKGRSIKW